MTHCSYVWCGRDPVVVYRAKDSPGGKPFDVYLCRQHGETAYEAARLGSITVTELYALPTFVAPAAAWA